MKQISFTHGELHDAYSKAKEGHRQTFSFKGILFITRHTENLLAFMEKTYPDLETKKFHVSTRTDRLGRYLNITG